MFKLLSFSLACGAILAACTCNAENTLLGDVQREPNSGVSERGCDLYQGDLGAEIGIGCLDKGASSGGPNHAAVLVTAPLPTPFNIVSHYYNIFTLVTPTLTALTFSVWSGGSVPGALIGQQSGMDFASGDHTVAISPPVTVNSAQFFFGQTQPQTDAALQWGVDTSSGGGTTSFIKAPACEVTSWATMTSIGFAGNWVMSVCVEGGPTPIELTTWGAVKGSIPFLVETC